MNQDKEPQNIEPLEIEIGVDEKKPDGSEKKVRVRIEPEDIIAISAGLVAVITALGMVFGAIPVNELAVGVLGFSGAGAAIAKIVGARRKKQKLE